MRIIVLGGGHAAVAAACSAAEAGHQVTLVHSLASVGGDIMASHHGWVQNGRTGEPLPLPVGATKKALYARLCEAGVDPVLLTHGAGLGMAGEMAHGMLMAHPFGLSYLEADGIVDAQGVLAGHLHGLAETGPWIAEYTFDVENVPYLTEWAYTLPERFGLVDGQVLAHTTLREHGMALTFRFPVAAHAPGLFARTEIERTAHEKAAEIAQYLKNEVLYFEDLLVSHLATHTRPYRSKDPRPLPKNVLVLGEDLPFDFSNRDLAQLEVEASAQTRGFLDQVTPADGALTGIFSQGNGLKGYAIAGETSWDMPSGLRSVTLDPLAQSFPVHKAQALVAGAGAGGAMAAWALGEQGVDTLVLDQLHFLGGTNTVGQVTGAWHGYTQGVWARRNAQVQEMMQSLPLNFRVACMLHWERYLGESVHFAGGVTICGVVSQGNRVNGALVYGEDGFALTLGQMVIDGTAESTLAVFAGAGYDVGGQRDGFVQSTSMWGVDPRKNTYFHNNRFNMDFDVVRPGDFRDLLRAIGLGHRFNSDYLFSDLYTVREGRRIHGDYGLNMVDIANRACFPDTIAVSLCTHDTHGRPNSMLNTLSLYSLDSSETREIDIRIRLPLRAFLPTGLEGIAIVGKCMAGEREATSLCRMNPDVSNAGYAVGLCVAYALRQGVDLRSLDLGPVQQILRELTVLPDWTDVPANTLDLAFAERALEDAEDQGGFPAMMLPQEQVTPMLLKNLEGDPVRARNSAVALAWFGKKEAAPILAAELARLESRDVRCFESLAKGDIQAVTFDGFTKVITKESKYGHIVMDANDSDIAYGRINQYIALLGLSGDVETGLAAVLPFAQRAETGGPVRPGKTPYSYARRDTHRFPMHDRLWSLCHALERLADPRNVPVLSRMLNLPGLAQPICTQAFASVPPLQCTYLELAIARALARCGGKEGALRLADYACDVRAVFAKMALDELTRLYPADCSRDGAQWRAWLESQETLPIVPYQGSPYA